MPGAVNDLLRAIPLFQGLSKREIRALASATQEVTFPRGEIIVKEGTRAIDFYVLLEGTARVSVKGRTRRRLQSGEHFGEIAVLDAGPRTATVTADEPVRALRLDREAFLFLVERNPKTAVKLLTALARLVREVERASSH